MDDGLIGPYRLIRRVGHGGMGAVYLAARADEQYQQQVAIKLVRLDFADSGELVARFRTERQILANLDHPNIARMLDGGVTSRGVPCLVMEYVDGVPIDEYCRKRGLPPREKIELFRTVCAAVATAHRNLVVHRDIKPSNILVTADGNPKLLDFGIAKLFKPLTGEREQTEALTRPAERLMTIEYASPEQVRGEPITTATDVYALGVVLYELLTSARPFVAHQTSLEMQRAICETEPGKPSAAARNQSKELTGDLDNILLMALRKEPEMRYASGSDSPRICGIIWKASRCRRVRAIRRTGRRNSSDAIVSAWRRRPCSPSCW